MILKSLSLFLFIYIYIVLVIQKFVIIPTSYLLSCEFYMTTFCDTKRTNILCIKVFFTTTVLNQVYVRVSILHWRTWTHKTSLNPATVYWTEVPVPSQENVMYMWVRGINFKCISTIFSIGFWNRSDLVVFIIIHIRPYL
jgi:hypothetical protein